MLNSDVSNLFVIITYKIKARWKVAILSLLLCFGNKIKEIWTLKEDRTRYINNNHWTLDKMQRKDMVLISGLLLPIFFVFIIGEHLLIETKKNNAIK